mgnify:FL=1
MKRVIRFRGKRIENGEWVLGDLIHFGNGCIIYHGSQENYEITNRTDVAIEYLDDEISVVNPDTVGQFTGLYDKNGKEIYEGDIVKTKEYGIDIPNGVFCTNVAGYDTFQIKWNNGGFHLSNDKRNFRLCGGSHLEFISNIHDNPELLEGGSDEE